MTAPGRNLSNRAGKINQKVTAKGNQKMSANDVIIEKWPRRGYLRNQKISANDVDCLCSPREDARAGVEASKVNNRENSN